MSSFSINLICSRLQSDDRRPKIVALRDLSKYYEIENTKSEELLNTFDECYLHLLKCYSDRYEDVRGTAVQVVTQCLSRLPPNDFHLVNIVGTLNQRLGHQETLEKSEEVRLLYVEQLRYLIEQYVSTGNVQSLRECYGDLARILCKSVGDSFSDVQRMACYCIAQWAKAAEAFYFERFSEQLAKSLYRVLYHKHSKTRIAALKALARVSLHLNASGDAFSHMLMEVSPLLMDLMPLVRQECGELGVLLLLEFRDRYSYFDRIIPLVLCCLKDSMPEVVDHIRPLWEKCGKKYYEENETELRKVEISDLPVENYSLNVTRPTVGCRGMVQRSLRLLQLITRESSDWKENVRLHSLKLLYQFVLHAEAAMTAKFFEIYPDVARACRDNEIEISKEAFKVADLMGRVLSYDDWIEHGLDGLEKNALEGYLKCFYYMFAATLKPKKEHIMRVSELLATSEFSQTLKPEIEEYVIKMAEVLLEKFKNLSLSSDGADDDEFCEKLYKNLYVSSIKVMAIARETQSGLSYLAIRDSLILQDIAELKNCTVSDLHECYFAAALAYVENLDVQIDHCSEPILLLCGLLAICEFRSRCLKDIQTKINAVFGNCSDEAKVKVFTTASIAMLNWNATIGTELEASCVLLKEFLESVVEPHLEWRAGANAEAMRSLATATLCSAGQGAPMEAERVLPHFAKYMPSLLEDHAVSTRQYAVKCMFNFGEIPMPEMKAVAYGVLQRLDDPSAGIRESAALALPFLRPKLEQSETERNINNDIWESFIKKAMDVLLLHYEGPEQRLREATRETILKFASLYPEICKDSFKRTLALCYADSILRDLEKELPFTL